MANTTELNLPNYVRPEALAVLPDLDLMADLLAGTRRMWAMSLDRRYIRKWNDEKPEVYNIRRQCESVFEGLGRTLSAAVGMLYAKPPAIVWNQSEEPMKEQLDDIDGMGTAWAVSAKRFSEQTIRDGYGVTLVDHPLPPPGIDVVTDAIALQYNLRPLWARYARRQVLSWRVGRINNRYEPVQVVLEECQQNDTGAYGVVERKRYRVLRLRTRPATDLDPGGPTATWELYEEVKDGSVVGGFKPIANGLFRNRDGDYAASLPLRVTYAGRTDAPFCASLPLLGVAFANLSHWQISTELRFGRMVSAIEQPVVVGTLMTDTQVSNGVVTGIPGKLRLGWLTGVHVSEGGDYKWVGPSGAGLDQLAKGVDEKLQQIGQMGMSFLVSDTRAAETAQAKMLDATAENSTLATAAQGIEDAENGCMELHAWYLGIEKDGAPVVTINKDFTSTVMDAQTMTAYVDAVARAGLPPRVMLEEWQRGGRIPADTDLDELLAELMTNAAAIEKQKQLDAEALAKQNTPPAPGQRPPPKAGARV